MRFNLYENDYILGCNEFNTAIVDGRFPASTAFIDVSEFTHFAFLVHAGTLDSALTLQVYQDTDETETAGIKVITGATLVVGTGDDNEWVTIEVEAARLDIANGFRYVTLNVAGAAGGNDYLDIIFLGWLARHMPVTQPAGYSNHILVAG